MTTALVRAELSRAKLEALAFGHAIIDPPLAGILLELLDPSCISPALRHLLEGISVDGLDVATEGKAQLAISNRAGEIPLREYRGLESFSLHTLAALINRLPSSKPIPAPAWSRRLDEGLASPAAAAL